MMTQVQLDRLRERMMQLKQAVQERRVEEREVWMLVQEASRLLNEVAGTPHETSVRVILDLMNSIWELTRKQQQLRRASRSGGATVVSG